MKEFFRSYVTIPKTLYTNRKLAATLAKNDFKTKYAGSYLGIMWAFIQPIVTVLVYWFVFTIGFRQGQGGEYPYVLFIITGIVPWFFFSDALNGGTHSLVDYNYLVKKVVFNIDILPLVKVMSALFVHMAFILFTIVLSICMGCMPSLYTIQIVYYVIANFCFVLSLVYFTSAIMVFFKDLGQFINICVLQVGIWLTPIMWNAHDMLAGSHPTIYKILKLNPMFYIVDGFRDSLITDGWFWGPEKWKWTICFWVVTILLFGIGTSVFRKLKVHFADVL